ncbi:MAG TPA: HNH endonuclease signature motif containing protein [Gaiellaceae bacterium]|nr:HNH endonuclease signature motif containing protein [Gaiellaceae bacterium]
MKLRLGLLVVLTGGLFTGGAVAARAVVQTYTPSTAACSAGYVSAHLSTGDKCLRNGEFCSASLESEYHAYGFTCSGGHLASYSGSSSPTTAAPTTPAATTTTTASSSGGNSRSSTPSGGGLTLGKTVRLHARSKTSGCKLGPNPDPACSPGAYYSGLTKAVLCSASFRTGTIRDVPESEKHAVEIEYGLAAKGYGSTLEIDHIVSLELGGSNDIANLYPELASPPNGPGFHVKDKLENKLHDLVCAGAISLSAAQRGIASNWQALYREVFGKAPRR